MSEGTELLELQEADFSLLRLRKQLDEIPQRAKLAEVSSKRMEVQLKAEQVSTMRADSERETKRLQDEGVVLRGKMVEAQCQIAESSDYREVAALSKEIEGLAKRAEKIEFESLKYMERADKITGVEAQVSDALAELARQETELQAELEQRKQDLMDEARRIKAKREQLVKGISAELLGRYDRAVAAKNGVGAAYLEGDHCSGCRVQLTDGQLAKLSKESEIASCPYCHRLLVIQNFGKR